MGNAIMAELEKNMDGVTLFHRFRYHLGSGFVSEHDKVADYGCGTGYGSKILSEKAKAVIAIDKEESNIEYARLRNYNYKILYKVGDLENMEVPYVDTACAFESIEHLYKPQEFVNKIKEKTKKYIIASVPLDQKLINVDGDIQEEGDSTHHSAFTRDSFMSMFIDDKWKEFWSFRDGVTLIAVFYNNKEDNG